MSKPGTTSSLKQPVMHPKSAIMEDLHGKTPDEIRFRVIEKHYKTGKREVYINDELIHTDNTSIYNNISLLNSQYDNNLITGLM